MDCLSQLAMSLIVDSIVAGTGPFFSDFFALAGTCRTIRAQCIEAARVVFDPLGKWDTFTGPHVVDLKLARKENPTPEAWRATPNGKYVIESDGPRASALWTPDIAKRAVATTLRASLFMRSMDDFDSLCSFSVHTFARYAPRELFDGANEQGYLAEYAYYFHHYDIIATRKLPFSLIPFHHIYNIDTLRDVIRADLDNGDFYLSYSREYLRTSWFLIPGTFRPPMEVLFGFPEATQHVARMFADFARSTNATIPWWSIEGHVYNYPGEIWKLRDLYMSGAIPFDDTIIENCRLHIIARLLALGIVTGASWTRGVRALRRYFVRISGKERGPSLNVELVVSLAYECVRCHQHKSTAQKLRVMFNELAITTAAKKDAQLWRDVEKSIELFPMIARFVARMKRACLRKRK